MQVLETIQEYTPIKHGWNYLSSWIGKTPKYDRSEGKKEEEDIKECQTPDAKDVDNNLELDNTEYQTPPDTSFLSHQVLNDSTTCAGCQAGTTSVLDGDHSCNHKWKDNLATALSDTSEVAQTNPTSASTPAHVSSSKAELQTPDIVVNNDFLREKCAGHYADSRGVSCAHNSPSCTSTEDLKYSQSSTSRMYTSEIVVDDPLNSTANLSDTDTSIASSSRTIPRENGILNTSAYKSVQRNYDGTRRFPKLLTTWHKRQLKGRRHKHNTALEGRIIFRRFRLPDSTSEAEPLQGQSRSKSESDLNGVVTGRLSETSGDSDQSVHSLNVLQENTDDDYVDIDFCHKGSLSGSSCRDTSISSGSLELSSDWTECTLSISANSIGEECRESDMQDTESCRSQDLSLNLQSHRTKRKRWKKRFMHGQAVNEFVDKECFCCHCVIL